jgi:4-amino-4-deoxy-L-arabinose transferase-like glycosyltransferase
VISALPIPTTHTAPPIRRWRTSSIALIVTLWAILQLGGIFSPGLLEDVDSVYLQVAREMLQRHDFVTPTIDGIRFFDKPPLMYWMAAGSMHLFGTHDWAARLPLALGVLALLLATYALGIRFYGTSENPGAPGLASEMWVGTIPTEHNVPSDRAGLYAALAMATAIGPYLYTRFYIPDILIALWMTLSVHLFLIALDRLNNSGAPSSTRGLIARQGGVSSEARPLSSPLQSSVILSAARSAQSKDPDDLYRTTTAKPFLPTNSALLPCLAFAAVTALNLLTKGLIGVVFPIGFVLLYLAFTRQLRLLRKLHIIPSTLVFLAIAAPWHILAALRNPPIPMPAGVGLPARAGWAWFYLYNEHIARFLGRRIPHDYGQVPIPIFWALLLLWLLPWVAFLPAALLDAYRTLRTPKPTANLHFDSDANFSHIPSFDQHKNPGAPSGVPGGPHLPAGVAHLASEMWVSTTPSIARPNRPREAALTCLLWAGIILGFFTLSSRQEYYHLPALPALALLVGGLLAAADASFSPTNKTPAVRVGPAKQALRAALYFLTPLGTLLFLVCGYFALTAPTPHPGATLNDVLSSNPALYDLSLGHVFDLTGQAMGFFRAPLLTVALCMLTLGPIAYIVRRRASASQRNAFAANLLIAAAMAGVLLAAHAGLVRFYPILGSKALAQAIDAQLQPNDLIIIDGELTAGSTLLFYTHPSHTPQRPAPVLLVNGDRNGPWFGGLYPDAPHIFLNDTQLAHLWSGPHRIFLLTYHPEARTTTLTPYAPVQTFATSGGKTILTNR